MSDWLIIDVSCLCYRFFHVLGDLTYGHIKTGVVFGFLRQTIELQDLFKTRNVAFCFDVGESKRVQIYEGYKAHRRARRLADPEVARLRDQLDSQITFLRTRYLPAIGYKNVFGIQGYEADDLIARIAGRVESAIVVSSDHDLFQLITERVRLWRPSKNKMMTRRRFKEEYGIEPAQWAKVKALSGCSTDEIPGVGRVGEKTALKFLNKELDTKSKVYRNITSEEAMNKATRNLRLVRLPLDGTPELLLQADALNLSGWHKVCDHLGMKTLRDMLPPGLRG
jgi:DNA polymerase I